MKRVTTFEFPYTCPKIDKAIGTAKGEIDSFLCELLEEACPLLPRARLKEIAAERTESLYEILESIFEEVRSTNEHMRREAESQIGDLAERCSDLEQELEAAS